MAPGPNNSGDKPAGPAAAGDGQAPAPGVPQTAPRQSIFREKSLERAASPERLDQYVKVSSPGAWAVLLTLLLLLAAIVAWLFVGTIPVRGKTRLTVANGQVTGTMDMPDGTYEVEFDRGRQPLADLLFGE